MACGRHAFGLVELDGWLYASGGSDFSRSEYNSLERYDPVKLVSSQGSWEHVTQTYNILLCLYFEKKKRNDYTKCYSEQCIGRKTHKVEQNCKLQFVYPSSTKEFIRTR